MAVELAEVARPYAVAAHKHASEAGGTTPGNWQEMLETLSGLMEQEGVQSLLSDPRVSPTQSVEALEGLLKGSLSSSGDETQKFFNFVRQLHEHDRLEAAEEISKRYRELRRIAEGELDVEIRSAFEVDDDRVRKISDRLKEKFGAKSVKTKVTIDPELSGGVVIIAGDDVIDGSVKSELEQMRVSLRKVS